MVCAYVRQDIQRALARGLSHVHTKNHACALCALLDIDVKHWNITQRCTNGTLKGKLNGQFFIKST